MSARYLITGAAGMLGTALQVATRERGDESRALARAQLDITDEDAVRAAVDEFAATGQGGAPDTLGVGGTSRTRSVVINAAAYTDVERAEDEPDAAHRVNEHGAGLLARAAREAGLAFVHVSTDFVFDGARGAPYAESDVPNPLSVYGASKLAGELAVRAEHPEALIVRTAWVYGPPGPDFPTKILQRALSKDAGVLRVVSDEIGCPTYAPDLARGILGLADAGTDSLGGLFHLAGDGSCSRFEMACAVLEYAGVDVSVEPVGSDAFLTKATRPADGRLDCSAARRFGVQLPPWRKALRGYVRESSPF